jgi:hypothetical protein
MMGHTLPAGQATCQHCAYSTVELCQQQHPEHSQFYPDKNCCGGPPAGQSVWCDPGTPAGTFWVKASWLAQSVNLAGPFYSRPSCEAILLECASRRCCCGPDSNRECTLQRGSGPCQGESCVDTGLNQSLLTTYYACPPCDPNYPDPTRYNCSETICSSGCCLCNRFCPLPAATCTSLGGTMTSQASCAAANRKPACRRGYWKWGKRPSQHVAGMTRPVGNNRMAIFSKQNATKDTTAAGTSECRTTYGWMQRHATKGMMHGAICNQFNRNCSQSRTSRKLVWTRHPTRGMMRLQGKYRRPCPEASEMGCSTTVNCTA